MAKQFEIDIEANLEIEVISDEDDNVKMLELVNEELSIEIQPVVEEIIVVKTMNSGEDMNMQLLMSNDLKLFEDPETYFGTLNNEDSVNELDDDISTLVMSNTID